MEEIRDTAHDRSLQAAMRKAYRDWQAKHGLTCGPNDNKSMLGQFHCDCAQCCAESRCERCFGDHDTGDCPMESEHAPS